VTLPTVVLADDHPIWRDGVRAMNRRQVSLPMNGVARGPALPGLGIWSSTGSKL